jgi:hypothetical protein
MTHQFDMMPAALTDPSVLERIDAQLPKVRDVKAPRLPTVLPVADAVDETFHDKHHESSMEISQ